MSYSQLVKRPCASTDMLWVVLMAMAVLGTAAVSQAGAAEPLATPTSNGCAAGAGDAIALRAAGRKVPIYVGDPEKQLSIAGYVDWKQLSPQGAPVAIAACFHEGYFRLVVPHLDSCKAQACWMASRWIVTRNAQAGARVTCQEIPTQDYAAVRGLSRKCRPE